MTALKARVHFGAAAMLLLAGCQMAATNVHNLEELHWSDGRHKRTGHIWNDYEYAVRVGIRGLLKGFGSTANTDAPEKIDDPLEVCVENLGRLVEFSDDDPWTAARQVELCARLAVEDPWHLAREIAVRELGRHGQRLALPAHPPKPQTGEPANVEAVRDALQGLVEASGPVLRGEPEASKEFAAACEAMGALELDRDGAVRLLRSVAVLERMRPASDERLAPLRELGLHLQRTCVTLALESALRDEPPREVGGSNPGWNNPRVRAAAIEACVEAWGDTLLARLLLEFSPRERDSERTLAFLRVIRRHGLPPPPPELSAEDRAKASEQWTEVVYRMATEHPEGEVRLAAMAALGRLSGREPYSVREEAWQDWWLARAGTQAASSAP